MLIPFQGERGAAPSVGMPPLAGSRLEWELLNPIVRLLLNQPAPAHLMGGLQHLCLYEHVFYEIGKTEPCLLHVSAV